MEALKTTSSSSFATNERMFYLYSCNRDWRDPDPLQWGNKYSAVSTLFGHISEETPGSQNGDSCLFEAEQELHRHSCELGWEE